MGAARAGSARVVPARVGSAPVGPAPVRPAAAVASGPRWGPAAAAAVRWPRHAAPAAWRPAAVRHAGFRPAAGRGPGRAPVRHERRAAVRHERRSPVRPGPGRRSRPRCLDHAAAPSGRAAALRHERRAPVRARPCGDARTRRSGRPAASPLGSAAVRRAGARCDAAGVGPGASRGRRPGLTGRCRSSVRSHFAPVHICWTGAECDFVGARRPARARGVWRGRLQDLRVADRQRCPDVRAEVRDAAEALTLVEAHGALLLRAGLEYERR